MAIALTKYSANEIFDTFIEIERDLVKDYNADIQGEETK
jgi:hypothetical protein